ncbi:Glutamate mutase sigma subunit (plasmid) [Streptomyces sp. enrichment culture]|uniref:cobalamin B12-binding domain-containing protein n=1 Tax=Streptomyces sp. enrichment culture TaxID=1795815 RepID=UPI003F562AE0
MLLTSHPRENRADNGREVILSTISSDCHTWNLMFMQLFLEEQGFRVCNLGAPVPDELLVEQCSARLPELVVISSVNGHGYHEGARMARKLRSMKALDGTLIVIGGKLGIRQNVPELEARLLAAGCDAVFGDTPEELERFRALVRRVPSQVLR